MRRALRASVLAAAITLLGTRLADAKGIAFPPEFGAAIVTGYVGIPMALVSLPSNVVNGMAVASERRSHWAWLAAGAISGLGLTIVGAFDATSGVPEWGVPILAYGVGTLLLTGWAGSQPIAAAQRARVSIAPALLSVR